MMHVLLESGAPAPKRLVSWTSGSVATHGAIVVVALWLTLSPPVEPISTGGVEEVVFAHPVVETPRVDQVVTRLAAIRPLGPLNIPAVVVPRITFPDYIPSATSSTDFPAATLFGDPRGTSTDPRPDAPFVAGEVERIVRARPGNPSPPYPSPLRSAGVEGDVLVRFVVDTLGRVELRSIEIRESTHAHFAEAVREWLGRTRYEPATLRGQPVRQLVEQRVGFTLRR